MKILAKTDVGAASRLRQGNVDEVMGETLKVTFDPLFENHKAHLEEDEVVAKIESCLREEFGTGLKLKMELKQAAQRPQKAENPDSFRQNYDNAYSDDPKVVLLQNIFDAKIRNVYSQPPEKGYHIGMSCNFED